MLAGAFALFRAGRDAEASLLVDQPAAQGDPEGVFTLADFPGGAGGARRPARPLELFRQAADGGHATSARTAAPARRSQARLTLPPA
jgi:hypothetical protein